MKPWIAALVGYITGSFVTAAVIGFLRGAKRGGAES